MKKNNTMEACSMKQLIALLLILSLIFTLGCAKPAEQPAEEEPIAEEAATEEDISDIESELEDIEDLDVDFLETELDNLDKELDFEI
jgi:outer membrane lipoprotein-sorting protein